MQRGKSALGRRGQKGGRKSVGSLEEFHELLRPLLVRSESVIAL